MEIYHYHQKTQEFLTATSAKRSPKDKKEVYLIPRFATDVPPPSSIPSGSKAVFETDHWDIVIDKRGGIYWDEDGGEYKITELGEDYPAWAILGGPPPSMKKPYWDGSEWKETFVKPPAKGLGQVFEYPAVLESELDACKNIDELKEYLRKILFRGDE